MSSRIPGSLVYHCTVEHGNKELFGRSLMPKVPYPYEVNGKLVTGNGSLIPICSLSNRSLLPSLTVIAFCLFFL